MSIFITFSRYVFSSIFTCTGFLLSVVVPFPSGPYSFFPVAHTVPSSFKITVFPYPCPTAGTVIAPVLLLYTFIIAFAFSPVFELYPVIVVYPIVFPVTVPFSSIVATSSFDEVHFQSL